MDRQILNIAFTSRDAYNELSRYLEPEEFEGHSKILLSAIQDYYSRDPEAQHCDADVILSAIERKHPKHVDTFRQIVTSFQDISVPNLMKEILEVKKQNTASDLSGALLSGKDQDVQDLILKYQNLREGLIEEEKENDTNVYQAASVNTIVQAYSKDNLIKVYPNSLNEKLGGGVPKQTHIVLYAEPEMGKSLVSINMAAGFCRDGHRTLYVENEDSDNQTLMRFVNRMSGMTRYEVEQDPAEAEARALQKGYQNLIFAGVAGGTVQEIERLIQEYEPECLIVNQIRHLKFKVDGEVAQITAAGKAMRSLIKKYNLVGVSVHQAADSATNKLVLERGDCYMSNTSLPGDADILLGIGANDQFKEAGRRMFSLAKNKITANHDFFPVQFNEQLSQVISI